MRSYCFYLLLTFLTACFVVTADKAQAWTGNDLWRICKERSTNQRSNDACRGLIIGAVRGLNIGMFETLFAQNHSKYSFRRAANDMKKARVLFCPPKGVTDDQIIDIVIKYLRDTPNERHRDFAENAFAAVRYAWPECK